MRPAPRLSPVPAIAAVAAVVALAVACAPGGASGTDPEPALTDSRATVSPPTVVMVDDLGDRRQVGPRDPLRIRAARVDGDSLRLALEFGGGCEQHRLRVAVSRAFRESYPVQVGAVVGHDARGDACDALLRPEIAVSLAPLAEAYRRAYGAPSGTVVIVLDGWSASLRYAF